MSTPTARIAAAGATAAIAIGLSAGAAAAHVGADKSEVPAGGFTSLTFTVPHGCEGSPTTALAFQIPEGILNASPQVHPGWDIGVEMEQLAEPVESSHGEQVTERPGVITFTAQPGNALPDGFRDTFTIGFQAPDTPGETMLWPIVQTCEVGETAWIEEPAADGSEPEHPAPVVEIVESEGDGHGAEASDEGDDHGDDAEATEVATDPVASTADDDGTDGLTVVALIVGALGLLSGGAALVRGRS
jgi:uncharacterized protein YcnI